MTQVFSNGQVNPYKKELNSENLFKPMKIMSNANKMMV